LLLVQASSFTQGLSNEGHVIFYMQMRWNIEESQAAKADLQILGMYKVAGQRRVIAIVDMPSADDLDRTIMGRLPLREFLEFEAIWPVRPFESFCRTHFGSKEMNA
jgi:muconolactone D-isomerase